MGTDNDGNDGHAARDAAASSWEIEGDRSYVRFDVRFLVVAHSPGRFEKFTGTLLWNPWAAVTAARLSLRIDARSVRTEQPVKDEHLRSAEFFDAARFPDIVFESDTVTVPDPTRAKHLLVEGVLTMHGASARVRAQVDLVHAVVGDGPRERLRLSGNATVDRREFGIVFNRYIDRAGIIVGDCVEIEVRIEASRAGPWADVPSGGAP